MDTDTAIALKNMDIELQRDNILLQRINIQLQREKNIHIAMEKGYKLDNFFNRMNSNSNTKQIKKNECVLNI